MWRLKQLIPKEQAGLEGKSVEVGSLKLQIRSTIAQGGFSSVYLARDAKSGKQYAVKHIICNDTESVDLVKKEVATMRALRGHPNVVALHSQSMYDMGRTKECFLVMEYCERMLVNVLDSKEGDYFEEKQVLLIFRDVCNAVYAMHCQSPPIAHRDLKAENLLLGSDGVWKLCDFGSTSTNHKRFERADEMGIEEDIIRKHTTPAYRAPEMWDLYRRDIISEKVDIWALGCLLYRIAYLKSAFDGESKLQILNGNYRIPDSPKFSANITSLIKDLLNSTPESRPDAMQVWIRVNDALPPECRKTFPDQASSTSLQSSRPNADPTQNSVMPTRAPPLPPRESQRRSPPPPLHKESDPSFRSKETGLEKDGAAVGSFWATPYAQKAHFDSDVVPAKDKLVLADSPPRIATKSSSVQSLQVAASPDREHQSRRTPPKKSGGTTAFAKFSETMHQTNFPTSDEDRFAPKFDEENIDGNNAQLKESSSIGLASKGDLHKDSVKFSPDEAFSEFIADFQKAAFTAVSSKTAGGNDQELQLEVQRLRTELNQVQAEKADIASKYEKLTAICRSQRSEIQDLKSALAVAKTATANNTSNSQNTVVQFKSSETQPPLPSIMRHSCEQKQEGGQVGSIWDLQEGLSLGGSKRLSASDPQGWRAFDDEDGFQAVSTATTKQSASNVGFLAMPITNRQSVGGSGMQSVLPTNKQQAERESYQQDSFGDGGGRDVPMNGSGKKRQQGHAHSRAASFQVGDGWGMMQDSFSGGIGGGFEATKGSVPSHNVPNSKQQLPAEGTYSSGFGSSTSARRPPSTTNPITTNNNKNSSRTPVQQVQPAGWAGF